MMVMVGFMMIMVVYMQNKQANAGFFPPPAVLAILDLRGCSCIQILMRNEAGGGHLVLCGT